MSELDISGSCLCGKIRYQINGTPSFPHLCSCTMCQKWSGAPLVGWVDFPVSSVQFDESLQVLSLFRSSAKTQRGFCGVCGSTLFALDDGAETICMSLGSMDSSEGLLPESHSFEDLMPSWIPKIVKT